MKKILLSTVVGLAIAVIPVLQASAWTYGLTGSGVCQSDGSYKITWTVDNSTEQQAMTIVSSSNTNVILQNTKVAAKKTASFTQSADGTKAGTFTLTLNGNWPSDKTKRSRSATVTLRHACTQPTPPVIPPETPPETPPVTPPVTPPATPQSQVLGDQIVVQPVAQVAVPKGAVNAGDGSASSSASVLSVIGLGGSLAALVVGVRRLIER